VDTTLKAKIRKIVTAPPRGDPYVVAYPLEGQRILPGQSITFSLRCWSGGTDPIAGQHVTLDNINQHEKGLRAEYAEPVRL
jgi:hypothetical protein